MVSFLALVAVVAAAFGLVACGGDSKQQQTQDAKTLLKQTFSGSKKINSGKLKLAVTVDAKGLKKVTKPIKLDLVGAFQNRGKNKLPNFDLALTAGAQGQTLTAGAISTGTQGFIKFQGGTYKVSGKLFNQFKKGFEQSQAKNGKKKGKSQSLSALGLEPLNWVSDPKIVGDTKVGDADTTHISTTLDVKAMLANLNTAIIKAGGKLGGARAKKLKNGIPPATQAQIVSAVKTATLDVYTGKSDKIVRKLTFSLNVNVPKAQQKKANGLQSAKIDFDLELTSVNQPQTIVAPKNAKSLSTLLRSLGGLQQQIGGAGK